MWATPRELSEFATNHRALPRRLSINNQSRYLEIIMIIKTPLAFLVMCIILSLQTTHAEKPRLYPEPINMQVPHVSTDKTVTYDYDIIYVRSPRHGDKVNSKWAEIGRPTNMEPGSDLMLLHPDGSEEILVKAGTGRWLIRWFRWMGSRCFILIFPI